jgi:rRNA maturation RNase YbeY
VAVSFNFQTAKFQIPTRKTLVNWILLVAYQEQKVVKDISYIFCDDEYLLHLNKKYLQHNTYTDVITFNYSTSKETTGEIYVSIDRVRENALKFKVPELQELLRVLVHGLLHCFGYSDQTYKSKSVMRRKENNYVKIYFNV